MPKLIIKPFTPECLPDEYCKYLSVTYDDYKCLKMTDVCRILGKNKDYVYWLIKSGQLKAFKVGNLYRVTKLDFYRYINNIDDNIKEVDGSKKTPIMPSNSILKTNQVAAMLHLNRKQVIKLFETGKIKAFRHNENGPWYTTLGEVDRFYFSI